MICTHSLQPLRLVYLKDGRRHETTCCNACYREFLRDNRPVRLEWENEYVRNVVETVDVKRLLEKGN